MGRREEEASVWKVEACGGRRREEEKWERKEKKCEERKGKGKEREKEGKRREKKRGRKGEGEKGIAAEKRKQAGSFDSNTRFGSEGPGLNARKGTRV